MRVVHRALSSIYDEALRPTGLNIAQLNLLVAVASQHGPRPTELAAALAMEKSTVSRNVERLRDKGWLRISKSGDARSHRLFVTSQGRRRIERALPAWREAQEQAAQLLGEANVAAIADMAGRMWTPDRRG